MACALGYILSPAPRAELFNELLTRETSGWANSVPLPLRVHLRCPRNEPGQAPVDKPPGAATMKGKKGRGGGVQHATPCR